MAERVRLCNCGSGKNREAIYDARSIFCAYVCDDCRTRKLAKYRPGIFTDPNYWTDEPVEPEDSRYARDLFSSKP